LSKPVVSDTHGVPPAATGSMRGLPASDAETALAVHCHDEAAGAALAIAPLATTAATAIPGHVMRLIDASRKENGPASPLRRRRCEGWADGA
jgi:hypothetical protein